MLRVINELKAKGAITDYAIGGGMGVMYYAEPVLTYDFDVICVFPEKAGGTIDPSPIFRTLKAIGYAPGDEDRVDIGGVPVQFIPASQGLMCEALEHATDVSIAGVPARVIGLEYLMANMLALFRAKDRAKLALLLEYDPPLHDGPMLDTLIKRYGLTERWRRINEQ